MNRMEISLFLRLIIDCKDGFHKNLVAKALQTAVSCEELLKGDPVKESLEGIKNIEKTTSLYKKLLGCNR